MTTREAREFLSSYKHKKIALKLTELRIQGLKRQANGNGSMSISETPGCNTTKRQSKDIIAEYIDLEEKLEKDKLKIEQYCYDVIETKIYKVGEENTLYANILTMYYVHHLTLIDISKEINYCYRQTKRLYLEAIKKFIKITQNIS